MRYLDQASALLAILCLSTPMAVISQKTCSTFGSLSAADSNVCVCPPGFLSSTDCLQPQCGGTILASGSNVAPQSTGTSGLRNVTAGDCDCESGWTGPVCSGECSVCGIRSDIAEGGYHKTVCSASQACASIFPATVDANSTTSVASVPISQNQDVICSNSPYIYASSQLLCNVLNPTLQSLFSGKSELGITRTVNAGNSPVGSNNRSAGFGDDGTAYAQLWYNGVEQVSKSWSLSVLGPRLLAYLAHHSSTAKRNHVHNQHIAIPRMPLLSPVQLRPASAFPTQNFVPLSVRSSTT